MNRTDDNQLAITDLEPSEIAEVLQLFKSQGRRFAAIYGHVNDGGLIDALMSEFARHSLPPPLVAEPSDTISTAMRPDGTFLAIRDARVLSACLTQFVDKRDVFVWCPKTAHYFKTRPVFVQSIPKSGTHVVFECLKAFGFAAPPSLDLPDFETSFEAGSFYNLQHMPASCLSFPVQRFPRFIRALSRCVTLFIVRDPRDVAVSFAHYLASQTDYHISASLFRMMSLQERLDRILGGSYPIPVYLNKYLSVSGNFHEFLAPYFTWWCGKLPNVWPLRFEDIIGPSGGGNAEAQRRAIWGSQLALHVPGRPEDYCDRIFSRDSLTFRRGQIGDYLTVFSRDHHNAFHEIAGAAASTLGYGNRWKFVRAFSVILSAEYQASSSVASWLRSELAQYGRDFSSVLILPSRGDAPPVHGDCIEVEANGIDTPAAGDRLRLFIEVDRGRGQEPAEPVNIDGLKYSLRVSKPREDDALVQEIILALLTIGALNRLPDDHSGNDVSCRFEGEIQLAVDVDRLPPIAEEMNYFAYNLVRYNGRFYAVPLAIGPFDLAGDEKRLSEILSADSLVDLKEKLLENRLTGEFETQLRGLEDSLAERTQRILSLETTLQECNAELRTRLQSLEDRLRSGRSVFFRLKRPCRSATAGCKPWKTRSAREHFRSLFFLRGNDNLACRSSAPDARRRISQLSDQQL